MADSDRLIKKKQTNFLLSNFREFYKLWCDNQEAILRVKSCGGKLTINFESSFKVPETKPTFPKKVDEKVKRTSPSRRKRNLARAELFRRNKASKDMADGFPATSEESQEDMQVSEASHESVLEKSSSTAVPSDKSTSIPEASVQYYNPQLPQTLKARAKDVKRDTDAEEDNFNDAEDWVPVSRVKSKVNKQSEMSLRIERFQTEIRPELEGTAKDWLESRLFDMQKRVSSDAINSDSTFTDDIIDVSDFIKEWTEGIESGGQPNLFDEQERRLQGIRESYYQACAKHDVAEIKREIAKWPAKPPRGSSREVWQGYLSAVSSYASYKQSSSAKSRKKRC